MQPIKKCKVDNEEYEISMLNPFSASDLISKISLKMLEPLGALISGIKIDGVASILGSGIDFSSAFKAVSANMTSKEFNEIVAELLTCVRLGSGMEIVMENHFSGRVLHMYKVAYKSFEVNFSDFLDEKSGVRALLKPIFRRAQQQSTGSAGVPSSPGLPPLMRSGARGQ